MISRFLFGFYERIALYLFPVLLFLAVPFPLHAATRTFNMTIEEVTIRVAPDLTFNTFAFDGQVPGPLIHVREGDKVTVHLTNNTSLPHMPRMATCSFTFTWQWYQRVPLRSATQ